MIDTLSVAPMMDWTNRHCRFFHRLLSQHTLLYSEMITSAAIIHGQRDRLLAFDPAEHPIVLQLGGSDPTELAQCARIGEAYGYDQINLNVGCPSDRVQAGRFGACLMAEPELVAECIAAMRAAVTLPVTIKTRIGIDELDSYAALSHFIDCNAKAGCQTFIIHARKAWLQGLSPKQNREIPPLQYATVYRLKKDFPALTIMINGGINDLDQAAQHLRFVDGVMLGRAAYHNPYILSAVDQRFFASPAAIIDRHAVIEALLPYIERQLGCGQRLHAITRHILGLFLGQPGAKAWRRYLSEHAYRQSAGSEVLQQALRKVSRIPSAELID